MRHGLPALAVVLLPALLTVVLLRTVLGASLFDTAPVINDEIVFWLEIATFRQAGFAGGYHSTQEATPPAAFCHFDPKGPGYPVLYGLAAKVVGWEPWSAPLFNLVCVGAATAVWLGVARPDGRRLAAAAALVATFWPLLLYLPTTMQESLHFAAAFLLAAAMQRAFAGPVGARYFAAVALLIAACALVRLTWGFVLLPWGYVGLRGRGARGRALGAAACAALFLVLVALSRWLNAPHLSADGIGVVNYLVREMRAAPGDALAFFAGHARWNLRNLTLPDGGRPLEVLLRYEVLVLLGVAAVLWRRDRRRGDADAAGRWGFLVLNLGPLLVASVLAYDVADWRDYRVLAPHLLLSLLLLAGGPCWRWVLAPAAANLLFVTAFLGQFDDHHRERVEWDRGLVAAFRGELSGKLRYDAARPPWDNTVLIPVQSMTYPMAAIPPGLGVNCVLDWSSLRYPPRSRYLLLPPDYGWIESKVRLRPLAQTHMGWLCLNLDAEKGRGPGRGTAGRAGEGPPAAGGGPAPGAREKPR